MTHLSARIFPIAPDRLLNPEGYYTHIIVLATRDDSEGNVLSPLPPAYLLWSNTEQVAQPINPEAARDIALHTLIGTALTANTFDQAKPKEKP